MALDFFHPSTARLEEWLETGESDKVGVHVEQCARCADRLVELDHADHIAAADHAEQMDTPGRQSRVGEALTALYSAPEDLTERVVRSVELRSKAERELALFAGLLTVGVETARLMADGGGDARIDRPSGESSGRYGQPSNSDQGSDRTEEDWA